MLKRFSKSCKNICPKLMLLSAGFLAVQACSNLPGPSQLDAQEEPATEQVVSGKQGATGEGATVTKIDISPAVQESYAQALALMKAEQYEPAIGILKEIAQTNQKLSGPYVNLGIIYLKLGRQKEAEQALTRAIEINPQNPAAHNLLGMLQRQNGLFKEAEQSYQKALATYPNYLHAHLNMGILCDLYLHNMECAMRHYERYLQLSEDEDKRVAKWLVDLKKRSETKTR